MKRPDGLESLTPVAGYFDGTAYPPLGFVPLLEGELGNGDYYGLYWPYGKEARDPIVCDMVHDEWSLEPSFSSAALFKKWLELNDGARGDREIEDPDSVAARFMKTRMILHNQPEEAISRLRSICSDFPEHPDYWFTLAGQLRRTGDHVGCAEAAIRSFASNWVFGMPPNGTIRFLQNAREIPSLADDPLVKRSNEIEMNFGGTKENNVYEILRDCIASYLNSENPIRGILLNQNYGYMMMMETRAFQERHRFDVAEWSTQQSELCATHLGDNRRTIS